MWAARSRGWRCCRELVYNLLLATAEQQLYRLDCLKILEKGAIIYKDRRVVLSYFQFQYIQALLSSFLPCSKYNITNYPPRKHNIVKQIIYQDPPSVREVERDFFKIRDDSTTNSCWSCLTAIVGFRTENCREYAKQLSNSIILHRSEVYLEVAMRETLS